MINRMIPMMLVFVVAADLAAQDVLEPSVGATGVIEEIILPGSELVGKPVLQEAPIIARITSAFPHGDSFRYSIEFQGLEPGQYDLGDCLQRVDGTSVDDLPEIPVKILSLLPPGQIEPNPPIRSWLPWLGGYTIVASLLIVLWLSVLSYLIFGNRKKKTDEAISAVPLTFADILQPRLEEAAAGRMEPTRYAELERMLFAFWRKRLRLENETPEVALGKIHGDPQAGPLMQQLENWMHQPNPDPDVDLMQLLKPYKDIPAESAGSES